MMDILLHIGAVVFVIGLAIMIVVIGKVVGEGLADFFDWLDQDGKR